MSNRLRIAIIGPGRVGRALAMGWKNVGHTIVATTSSSKEQVRDALSWQLPNTPMVAADELPDADLVAVIAEPDLAAVIEPIRSDLPQLAHVLVNDEAYEAELAAAPADLVAVTTPDDAVGPVVDSLAKLGRWRPGQIVLHTSGSHGLDVLEPAARAGALTIAIHPAMTFSGYSLDLQRLVDCPVAVTASAVAMPIAQALIYELQAQPVPIEDGQRQLYHAALTHGANHIFTVLTQARSALELAGVEDSGAFLRPLAQASLENALAEDPSALTGPVVRADTGTLRRHLTQLQSLQQSPAARPPYFGSREVADTYLALAQATALLAHEAGRLSQRQLDAVLLALRDKP